MGTAIEIAVALCRRFEGFSSVPYLCPAGVPTIGFGSTYYADGTKVTLQDQPISREHAENLLEAQLVNIYMAGVIKASPGVVAFQDVLGALTSFAYNLGVPRYRASTLRRRVDAQDWPGAVHEIKRWNRAGGRVLKGLATRREAEASFIARKTPA